MRLLWNDLNTFETLISTVIKVEEKEAEKKMVAEGTEEEPTEEGLPFPNARVVAIMRKYLAHDKMIKSEVKKAMNRFLEQVVADVCKRMDQYPYAMVDYWMFEKAIEPYGKVKVLGEEKERVIKHLETMRTDVEALIRDIKNV